MGHHVEILAENTGLKDGIVEVPTSFLEDYFGVSRKTLSQWETKGCPKLSRGRWDFIAVLKWKGGLESLSEDSPDSKENIYLSKLKAETFLKEQQGQIAEIELQKLRGEVIDISEVERIIGGIIVNTKNLLLAMPTKAAPRMVGLSILDDFRNILLAHAPQLANAKDAKTREKIVDTILAELSEADSVEEISDILSGLIYESLEQLADVSIEQFGGDSHTETDAEGA